MADEDVQVIAQAYKDNDIERLMEVYNLSIDIELQLKEVRVFNY